MSGVLPAWHQRPPAGLRVESRSVADLGPSRIACSEWSRERWTVGYRASNEAINILMNFLPPSLPNEC